VNKSFDKDDDPEEYTVSVSDIIKANRSKQSIADVQSSSSNDEPEDEEEDGMDEGKGFSGGYVMEPIPGWYENIPILDFNSLYPNLMMTYFLERKSNF
jgi:hypothetical protein